MTVARRCLPCGSPLPPLASSAAPHRFQQRATLVNARIKWAKDPTLDAAVARERHLRPALHLVHAISASSPSPGRDGVPLHHLPSRRRLALPSTVPSIASFMRRHPALFHEQRPPPPPSSPLPATRPFRWFGLTPEATALCREEAEVLRETEGELVDRLRKLLMLAAGAALPLPVVDQLRWDLGLPLDYRETLLPRYPHFFRVEPAAAAANPHGDTADERPWLRLLCWDARLAISHLQMEKATRGEDRGCLAFPVRFPRGFGLKKKWMAWLEEWQRLPYTSPYDHAAAGQLDPRTDAAEKRVVAVFHELLHLMVGKKTERANLSNLRLPLGLPYKFSKVFGRHPGVFYLSPKLATQTVVLREAYGGGRARGELLEKHPVVEIREKFAALMRVGREDGEKVDAFGSGEEEDVEKEEFTCEGS